MWFKRVDVFLQGDVSSSSARCISKDFTDHRKHMADNLPLPSVLRPIPRVKQSPPNTDERIVKLGLQESIAVAVDLSDSGRIRNGDMIRCDPDEFPVTLVLCVDDLVSVAAACLTGEPEFGEGGGQGARVFAETVGVEDKRDED